MTPTTTVASLAVCKPFERCKTDRDCKGGRCVKIPGGNPWIPGEDKYS